MTEASRNLAQADPFLRPDNPLLRMHARGILPDEIGSDSLKQEIKRMIGIANNEQVNPNQARFRGRLVGLAHPQIATDGDPRRLIVVNTKAFGDGKVRPPEFLVVLNPTFVPLTDEQMPVLEGCFSVDERVAGYPSRIAHGRVTGLDESGRPVAWESQNPFQAAIGQHETDHTNGSLYIDHIRVGEKVMLRDSDPETYRRLKIEGLLAKPDNDYQHRATDEQLHNLQEGRLYDVFTIEN